MFLKRADNSFFFFFLASGRNLKILIVLVTRANQICHHEDLIKVVLDLFITNHFYFDFSD